MLTGFKIRIHPTQEQIKKFRNYSGTSRFLYNWTKNRIEESYKLGIKFNDLELYKELTSLQKTEEFKWLMESPRTMKNFGVRDCIDSYKKFFKGQTKYPKFKSKKKDKVGFSYEFTGNFGTLPNVGIGKGNSKLKLSKSGGLTEEVRSSKVINRLNISYDNKYWYLSGAYEKECELVELTNSKLGIDLGLKDLAITNTGIKFKNINKTHRVKKLKKKLRRVQRSLSRKYLMNKDGNKFITTSNISKQLIELRFIHRRLTNIRKNHIEQITTQLVKTKPIRIVMEDLNVSGMMKNRHLAKAIAEATWYYFIDTMRFKCKKFNIEFILADRFFASSKNCSSCGTKKKDLKLKDRTYHCSSCDLSIDRDINAAINLANYTI